MGRGTADKEHNTHTQASSVPLLAKLPRRERTGSRRHRCSEVRGIHMSKLCLRYVRRMVLPLSMLALTASPVVGQTGVGQPGYAQPDYGPMVVPELGTLPPPDLGDLRMTPSQARTPEDYFKVFDEDDNGCIDRSEWRRRIMAIFFALDTKGTREPAVFGVQGDDELSRDEIPGISEELFNEADLDRNGAISGYEFNQASWTRYEAANPGIADCLDLAIFTRFHNGLRGE